MRLYNTLSRAVEELVPDDVAAGARPLGIYVCGPTVQDAPHFGHARAALVPDVLRRYLEWSGVEVVHVRNITDVDDKIIAKSLEQSRDSMAVAEQYTRIYERLMDRLGLLPPHVVPRATGHILEMIELIEALIAAGAAYESGGDVWFRVRSFPRYGALSGRDVDELRSGARVEADERKDDPLDFALWKAAKPGEPRWRSPWGEGRPGWHIECSAMARRYLGDGFDLHAGGIDLVFPHHENEIAQAEAATGRTFARHWLHNGHVHFGAEKMSKSLGNVVSLADALEEYGPGVLRLALLQSHYRSPVEWSPERLSDVREGWGRWQQLLRATAPAAAAVADAGRDEQAVAAFRAAMDDDLGTATAVAGLFDLASRGFAAVEAGDDAEAARVRATFLELAGVLGFDLAGEAAAADVAPLVEALLELRRDARERRDFATADRIREQLTAAGVVVEDTAAGARWYIA